jgi:hypothetical protein
VNTTRSGWWTGASDVSDFFPPMQVPQQQLMKNRKKMKAKMEEMQLEIAPTIPPELEEEPEL